MVTLRLSVTGSAESLDALEAFCQHEGIEVQRGASAANDRTAQLLVVLYIIAKFDVIPKCISAFMRNRKRPPKFTRFIEGKGFVEFEGYSPEEIAKILSKTDEFHIEDK